MNSNLKKALAVLFSVIIAMTSATAVAYAEDETTTEPSTTVSKEEAEKMLNDQKADLAQKLKDSEEKLSKFSAEQKVTAEYINALDEKIGYLNEDLTLLDTQVKDATEKVDALTAEINDLTTQIETVQSAFDDASKKLDKLYDSFETTYNAYCLRMRAMYVSGSGSVIVALLTSKDISQLFSRYEMIKAVSKTDTALLNEVNKKIEGLVSYEEGKGYNGYSVNLTSLVDKSMTSNLSLTEKQVGAIAQTVFYEQTGGKIKLGEKEVSVTIVQVDFSEIAENGSANFNVVAKLDLTPFKEDMKEFPYKYFKKYIPNNLYISSTVRIEKTEKNFSYSITHKSLALNNLSSDDTADFFDTLNAVLKLCCVFFLIQLRL